MDDFTTQNNSESTQQPKTSGGIGPMVGAVIIVAILILGGLYYWMTKPLAPGTEGLHQDASQESTEPEQIEADLNASVDLDALDADIDAALKEVDEAL